MSGNNYINSPFSLKCIIPPPIEPVDYEYVKLHAHIDHDVEDTLIESWIKTGRMLAETYQRRAYIKQTWRMSFDYLRKAYPYPYKSYPDLPIYIPRSPLRRINSIKYYDYNNVETSMSLASFNISYNSEPATISLSYQTRWPSVILRDLDSFRIEFECGYDDLYEATTTLSPTAETVPSYIKDAIVLYCTWACENRAGETKFPQAFYDLLSIERIHTP